MIAQETIDQAMRGDESALNEVLFHYRPYIRMLSRETVCFDDGRRETSINAELEGEIISHILGAIIKLGEKHGKSTSERD